LKKEKTIIKQGDRDDDFYFLDEVIIHAEKVFVMKKHHKEIKIMRLGVI
jgi:hypothetical protein